jgi:hypothetical protein
MRVGPVAARQGGHLQIGAFYNEEPAGERHEQPGAILGKVEIGESSQAIARALPVGLLLQSEDLSGIPQKLEG